MRLDDEHYSEFREPLLAMCEGFPGAYWRQLEDRPVGERFPQDFFDALVESGFLGAILPEEFSGAGLSIRTACIILQTIHTTSCTARAALGQMYLPDIIVRHGSDAQKQKYLADIAAGRVRFLSCADREAGPELDLSSIATTARKTDGGYVMSGKKTWVRCVPQTDLLLLFARTSPAGDANAEASSLSAFLIDLREIDRDALSVNEFDAMVNGQAADIEFRDLKLPLDSLIGEEGKGAAYHGEIERIEAFLSSACALGDAAFFSERAVNYANERVVFGKSISHYQGIQFPISRAHIDVQATALMLHKASTLFDAGEDADVEAKMARYLAARASWTMADTCFTTHGGFAFAREYDIERKWRDARVLCLETGPADRLLDDVARNALSLDDG